VRRTAQICRWAGIAEQRTLAGPAATRAAVLAALREAAAALRRDGLLALTFSGHTVRGDGPIEAARWCLFDGGLAMAELAAQLARLPATSRLVIITDVIEGDNRYDAIQLRRIGEEANLPPETSVSD